jgi:hypothetical protein
MKNPSAKWARFHAPYIARLGMTYMPTSQNTDMAASRDNDPGPRAREYNPYRYVIRTDQDFPSVHGWRVRMPRAAGGKQKLFSDSKFGGKEASLAAAMSFRDAECRRLGIDLTRPKRSLKDARNTSGYQGIAYSATKNAWLASWMRGHRQYQKGFSVKKYGRCDAFILACRTRYEMAGELLQLTPETNRPCHPDVPVKKAWTLYAVK